MILFYILISVLIVSLASLIGIIFISIKKKNLEKILILLVSLATGSLLGGAFFHLLPESLSLGIELTSLLIIAGFLIFFILEKFVHWRHCHDENCKVHPKVHPFAYLILVGDSVHNFIDGLVISAAYLTNITLGISTTLAILIHEIPQEIGDFAVLVHGGFKRKKALYYNFLTALTAVVGALIGFFIFKKVAITFLLPIAAGGFIYIATTDLIPELHKRTKISESVFQFIFILIGLALMWLLRFLH
jgi:zinc and cadmium transporter